MTTEEYTDISVKHENGVTRITISRPDKLNAIRITTYREIIAALRAADRSEDCRIIVLQGEGEHFTAGNDLSDLVGPNLHEVMNCVRDIFNTVAQLKKVLIAAVEGVAVGIGTTILLHCDMVVASSSSRFRVPFANLGVCPEGASSSLLPLVIGQKRAREVLLTGRFFSAEEALSWGLINQVTEPGGTGEAAEKCLDTLLKQPLSSLLATKELMHASRPDVQTVVDEELKIFGELLQTDETSDRIKALLR
ncbi:enoyl-CoA hydratase/isomerase family protein [Desulfosediminicola sp.]|uniref:enoyl-CoA hydratase/isomerase family protein n=1 Tax=Desulfosediminicola sp. TaxID=2886825 RepID=UPI003AF2154B